MLKECCYSLDLYAQNAFLISLYDGLKSFLSYSEVAGSSFWNRMTMKPLSPMFAILSSRPCLMAMRPVALPTALTLLYAPASILMGWINPDLVFEFSTPLPAPSEFCASLKDRFSEQLSSSWLMAFLLRYCRPMESQLWMRLSFCSLILSSLL